MMAGSERPVSFATFPVRIGFFEAWNGTITSTATNTLLAVPHLQMAEGAPLPGGTISQEIFDIDASGLEASVDEAACVVPCGAKQRETDDRVTQPHIRSGALRSPKKPEIATRNDRVPGTK
jgi:hypothetical protein